MSSQMVTDALQHIPRLVLSHNVHEKVHGAGTMARFNARLAVRITNSVGTMWTAYIFCLLALVSLPAVLTSANFVPSGFFPGWVVSLGLIALVAWIAQTFLQLVLLPVIIVGQNVIQAANDARAEADHETLTAVHRLTVEVHAINEAQTQILEQLQGGSA